MKFTKLNPKRFFSSKKHTKPEPSPSSSSSVETKNHSIDSSPYSQTEILKAFKLIDRDNDGVVSRTDLEILLSQLGRNKDEIDVMLQEVDREGHGTISLETLASRVVPGFDSSMDGSVDLKETFEIFDEDKDGLISAEELLRVFGAAIGDEKCTLEECVRMIASVDEDGDGFVSFDEFYRMMVPQQ